MSVLLVDAYLSQPGVYGQHLHLFIFTKLIDLPHFSLFFSGPEHVSLKHIQTVRVTDVCNDNKRENDEPPDVTDVS